MFEFVSIRPYRIDMPQHKSAERRMRTSTRRRARNRHYKSMMKNLMKELRGTTDKTQAEALYRKVAALLDRVATKGVIHGNNAAHKKSQLAKYVQSLG
jgi:small subunit ribosomal protein S20